MQLLQTIFNNDKKIWSTPKTELVWNTECSLGKVIYNQLNSFPDVTIQIDHSANVTLKNRDVLIFAKRIAQHFDDLQLKEDDVIGFAVRNSTYVLPTVIACFFNCTPFHAINPILDQSTLAHCFGITKPKLIFCDSDAYEKVYLATEIYKPKIVIITGRVENVQEINDFLAPTKIEHAYRPIPHSRDGHKIVAILSSSGTTGKPKAVCLSSYDLIFEAPYINSGSIMYVPSCIDWITGLLGMILSCLNGATRVIVDKPFSPDDFFMLVKKYKITYAFMATRNIAAIVKHPKATKEVLASLRIVQTGGSTLSEKILKAFKALLSHDASVMFCYGLTECGVVALNMDDSPLKSVGKLYPGVSLRIVDDNENNLGHNEVGEIYVNREKNWEGYYGNIIETQRIRDTNGWFHTGDLGFMDNENCLYVVDRKKEIRKYLGFQFWPKEIEETIVEMPGINDACVITIRDETRGDCSGALVVKEANSSVTEQEIIDYVKKRLVDAHKQIHAGVYFVNEIPQNANGKTAKLRVMEIFEGILARNENC